MTAGAGAEYGVTTGKRRRVKNTEYGDNPSSVHDWKKKKYRIQKENAFPQGLVFEVRM